MKRYLILWLLAGTLAIGGSVATARYYTEANKVQNSRLEALDQAALHRGSISGATVYVLTIGDYRALHSWGPFSSWQAAYDRLAELELLGETWEIAPRVIDGPLSTLQAAQP